MTDDIDFLIAENEKKPIDPPPPLISEWVQGFRVMPTNTPIPGLWDNANSWYLVEPTDNMSPYSPVITTSIMKGVQLGCTAAAENVIGYFMKAVPTEVLYISATDDLLEKWATKRLEPLIDSIGMRDLIFFQADASHAKSSRRTGDKMLSKQYVGGNLNMASAQSAASLRSDSKRILVLDEVDGAPRLLKTGEGTWIDVAKGRTAAWGARKKILEFSTPTTIEDSLINERYEAGDRRKYFVPCPYCGVLITLEFEHLRHEMRHGRLFSVWYECQECSDRILNHQKTWMMDPKNGAAWEPTGVASSKGHRSYHISSMYSPSKMLSWFEMMEKYLDAKATPGGMRSFTNLYLGLPYKEEGVRPKPEKIVANQINYKEGEVPDGVLYLTVGVDVQRGNKNDPKNPPRLELEVLGIGAGYRTWSILYRRFEGDVTTSAFTGAWEDFNQWAVNGGLTFRRADGTEFHAAVVFIDSGDGDTMDIVYSFTSRWGACYPSKGFRDLRKRKEEKGDEMGMENFKRYRIARTERSGDYSFVEIATNYYKSIVYHNLEIPYKSVGEQLPGFCAFPRDRLENCPNYFEMLTNAEKRSDGSFHDIGSKRVEALDCRVMALCAGDMYLDTMVTKHRMALKATGKCSELEIQQIDHRFIIEMLTRQTASRRLAA